MNFSLLKATQLALMNNSTLMNFATSQSFSSMKYSSSGEKWNLHKIKAVYIYREQSNEDLNYPRTGFQGGTQTVSDY